ncbi:MAG: carboxypeptidase-like regulatory domain-containing protein [Ignavibacteriales bacterium]|nr:carboxypeptidase-like regulatory domain-containing protein [Ignavibacteriales bacterium]
MKLSKIFSEQNPSFTTTNKNGDFEFVKIEPGRYLLEISFIGYNKSVDTVRAGRRDVNLGNILMTRVPVQLEQVEVIGNIIQAEQKEDTIQFLAKGFKTNVDATARRINNKDSWSNKRRW